SLSPLRNRGADIERLAEYFRGRFARELGRDVPFAPEALSALRQHPWRDNVPELENAVQRAVLQARGPRIEPAHLSLHVSPPPREMAPTRRGPAAAPPKSGPMGILPLKEALEEPEKQLILQALQALSWNRQETARVLDINRTTLYKKMKKYGLLFDEPVWAN